MAHRRGAMPWHRYVVKLQFIRLAKFNHLSGSRPQTRLAPFALAVGLLSFGPAKWLTPERFSAYAIGLQAFAVLLALGIAVGTLSSEIRDRRLDRVLALHSTFMEGELGGARYRFIRHVRSNRTASGLVRRITRDDLMEGEPLAEYPSHYWSAFRDHNPRQDANLVIRHFERVDAARAAGSVDDDLLFRLLGPQAVWWDNALQWEPGRLGTWAIDRLARWARQYVLEHSELPLPWGEWQWDIEHDFGHDPSTRPVDLSERPTGVERLEDPPAQA